MQPPYRITDLLNCQSCVEQIADNNIFSHACMERNKLQKPIRGHLVQFHSVRLTCKWPPIILKDKYDQKHTQSCSSDQSIPVNLSSFHQTSIPK